MSVCPTATLAWVTEANWVDIETLGGAGFASQRHLFGPLPLHLPELEYQGLCLSLHPDTSLTTTTGPKTFTLVLKTTLNTTPPKHPKTPPEPDAASLSYEANFTPSPSSTSKEGGETMCIAFGDFVPMYRGKEVKSGDRRYKPLLSDSIYELSLMCRSRFGEQKGEFGVVVLGIAGWSRDKEGVKEVGSGSGWWGWLVGVGGWVGSWCGGGEGKVRLDENGVGGLNVNGKVSQRFVQEEAIGS